MPFYILALGNPGEEYEETRHSVGRMIVDVIAREYEFSDWKAYKNKKTETAKGEIADVSVNLIKLEEFMNTSGRSGGPAIKAGVPKRAIVVHDDLDLPMGSFKVSYGRGSGGHKGVESLIKNLKTKNFWRVRVGISPKTASGKIRKINDHGKVKDHVLKTFSKKDKELLEKEIFPEVFERIEDIVTGKTKPPKK
ncbi:hypothetical protein CL654_01630 [bacterium]|nr:hypothetical protein [bacterium]|tara:strand:- start:25115 stop:25696 length:582 start_codon:yes stop_codon:yes gene_type:complete